MNITQCSICENGAKFLCQCLDPYCSQQCRIIDWPIHRKTCIPMPDLIAVEHLNISCDIDAQSQGPVYYSPNSAPNKSNSNPPIKWKRTPKCRSISGNSIDFNRRNLRTPRSTFDAKLVDRKQEMWESPYPLSKDEPVEVIVQYSVKSPTTTCWVTQRERFKELELFTKGLFMLHSFKGAIQRQEIKLNEIYCVLVEDVYHRGVVVYFINSLEVVVRLIDIGRILQIEITAIKALNTLSRDENAFAFAIQFEEPLEVKVGDILNITEIFKHMDGHGVTNVQVVKVKHVEAKIEDGLSSNSTVMRVLAKRHLRGHIKETRVFTYRDLKTIPLPNTPIELYCLDFSNIKKGCISVCANDPKKIKEINDMADAIEEYCEQLKNVKRYCPQISELCLVYHDSYKQWYRGECIKIVNSRTFKVIFTDYGTYRVVGSSDIRQMDEKFMQPVIMHMCMIDGVPMNPSKAVVDKLIAYFNENPIFQIESAEKCEVLGEILTRIYLTDLLF